MSEAQERQRIDKWLWFARFARTRTLAQKLVAAGAVRLNRERIDSASRLVKPGDVLTVSLEHQIRVVRVLSSGERRGPASEAQELYEEVTPPAPVARTGGGPRPTKRDRRALDALHGAGEGFPGMPVVEAGED